MHDADMTGAPPLELLDIGIDDPPRSPPDEHDGGGSARRRLGVAVGAAVVIVGAGLAYVALRGVQATNPAVADALPLVATREAATTGVAGFAELFLSTYLTAAGPDRQAAIDSFHPSAPAIVERAVPDRYVTRIVTLGVAGAADRGWDVHLAAEVLVFDGDDYVPDGVHHYMVGVAHRGGRLQATSLPARIASPAPPPVPEPPAGERVEDPALTAVVDGFLAAMLTGEGDLGAYVPPGSGTKPVDPPAFAMLEPASVTASPGPDGNLSIRAVTTAHPAAGTPITVEYHLGVDDVGGSWVVTRLTAGPPAKTGEGS